MKRHPLAVAALLAWAAGACFAGEGGDDPAASLEKERQAGSAFVTHLRDQFGASTNARYRAVAGAAVARLAPAADARPEIEWHAEILRHDARNPVARNASAWPGGYLVTDDAFMRLIEEEAGGKPDRMEALAAGVLAHEMGHVLHRDTDFLVRAYFQKAGSDLGALASTLLARPSRGISAAEQRRKEEMADRDGAFMLLRAGYRIEDMVAVFRRLAREDVGEVLFTGELDHTKAADRVAYLLRIEAEVVEDQTRYDEAVTVLRLGMRGPSLDSAIRSIDMVCRHFPNNIAVRHALAAAYHRDYLASLPVAGQRFRPAFAFYRFEVSRDARVGGPRLERLRAAVNAYQEILRRGEKTGYRGFGPTASAYALAAAQLGRADEALRWARRGVDLAPASWPAWNTLGNVLQSRGDAAGALDAYSRALGAASARYALSQVLRAMYAGGVDALAATGAERVALMEFAPIYFNLASASEETRKTREAGGLFRVYLAVDREGDWHALVRSRLEALGVPPTPLRLTEVAGVQVSDRRAAVEKAWGPPSSEGKLPDGSRVLKYPAKGLTVTLDKRECVAVIGVQPAFRGDLGIPEVALGATADRIERVFGLPLARTAAGVGAEAWDYPPCGVTLFMGARGLERMVVYGRPDPAVAPALAADLDESGFAVGIGESRAQVRAKLGDPDRVSADGVWLYGTRGIRVRFAREGRADLVVASRPCEDRVHGIRIGDPASKIGAELGEAQAAANLDDTVTYAFPGRGVAYVVQDGQVTAMVLYLSPA